MKSRLKHIIRLNIEDRQGNKRQILESGFLTLPKKILRKLLGEGSLIYILRSDESVSTIELVRRKNIENTQQATQREEDIS